MSFEFVCLFVCKLSILTHNTKRLDDDGLGGKKNFGITYPSQANIPQCLPLELSWQTLHGTSVNILPVKTQTLVSYEQEKILIKRQVDRRKFQHFPSDYFRK